MDARPAQAQDLPAIVELTRANRGRLASWSPVYLRPRDGADEAHAAYLTFLVHSSDHPTTVFVDDSGDVVGFFHLVAQRSATWVDDLCFENEDHSAHGFENEDHSAHGADFLQMIEAPWVTNVARRDEAQAAALTGIGLTVASTYFSKSLSLLSETSTHRWTEVAQLSILDQSAAPLHTFGGAAFLPNTPGALVVTGDDGGALVGSPSAEPPIYDPGGPTCVVDQVTGGQRSELLAAAMGVAAARGDAQMIVVCADSDTGLGAALTLHGFTPQVDLYLANS